MGYRSFRTAADNAASIGNHTAAAAFAAQASACDYVEVAWARVRGCICLSGSDLTDTKTWATKLEASAAAKRLGWLAKDAVRVHHPLFGERWALADGRFGLMSKAFYAKLDAQIK